MPTKFKFFNDIFNNLNELTYIEKNHFDEWHGYDSNQLDVFVDMGMKTAKEFMNSEDFKIFKHQNKK